MVISAYNKKNNNIYTHFLPTSNVYLQLEFTEFQIKAKGFQIKDKTNKLI